MKVIAVLFAKIVFYILRFFNKGATTLPGKVALFFYKPILKVISKGVKVVLVTGTNGKTTTCRIIEKEMIISGKNYFINRSGANLLSGIITAFVLNCSIFGKCKKDCAIIECDENAFNQVSKFLEPEIIVVTNIFRDQLDRYCEVTSTLSVIEKSISRCKNSTVILNADCPLTYSISKKINNRVLTFGVEKGAYQHFPGKENSDAPNCIFCGSQYKYNYFVYSHLGGFVCENCGYKREKPNVFVSKIFSLDSDCSCVKMNVFEQNAVVNLEGIYNIYNSLAAVTALLSFGEKEENIYDAISSFEGAFGRCETFETPDCSAKIMLVKNPAGFTLVNSQIENESLKLNSLKICFCLNDNIADGRDISWIYDVDFSGLKNIKNKISNIYVCGSRAYEMALCLKLNGFDEHKIELIENENYRILPKIAKRSKENFYIVPTYTSMMSLRPCFAKEFDKKEFYD